MSTTSDTEPAQFRELTHEEGVALFDEQARRSMGMSGEEFLRAWDAGEIDPDDPRTHNAVVHMYMLIPFARSADS